MDDRSTKPWRVVGDRQRTVVFWLWVSYSVAILAMSFVPGESVPEVTLLGWDKLAHAVAFAVLGALTLAVLARTRRWFWWVLGYGVLVGAATEWFQRLTPGRTMSLYDWVADLAGTLAIALGVAAWTVSKRRRRDAMEALKPTQEEAVPIREG